MKPNKPNGMSKKNILSVSHLGVSGGDDEIESKYVKFNVDKIIGLYFI